MVLQLIEKYKNYLFSKNLKTKKNAKNLTLSKLDNFLLYLKKELLAINSSYLKILNYFIYFIYYY